MTIEASDEPEPFAQGSRVDQRVPAAEIEQVVADAVRQELGTDSELATRDLIEGHVTRVEVHTAKISVELRKPVPNQRPSKFLGESLRSSDAASSSHPHQAIARTASDPRRRPCPSHCCAVARPAVA
jgi:hypothetical protein